MNGLFISTHHINACFWGANHAHPHCLKSLCFFIGALIKGVTPGQDDPQAGISLQDIPLFQDLSIGEVKTLQRYLKNKVFEKGEIISIEGEVCQQIFFVRSGRVKIFKTSVSGKELILEVLESGDTCACHHGETQRNCTSSAQAMTACELWFFPRYRYIQLAKDNLKLMCKLNELFARRLSCFSHLIQQVSLDDPQRRLIKFILDMSESPSSQCSANGLCISQEEISLRIGLVRETVTRHLHHLKCLGLIALGKSPKITILNKGGLQKLLS